MKRFSIYYQKHANTFWQSVFGLKMMFGRKFWFPEKHHFEKGVPLGLLAAFALHLPIVYDYLLLSFEEVVRLMIAAVLFWRKKWMQSLA